MNTQVVEMVYYKRKLANIDKYTQLPMPYM